MNKNTVNQYGTVSIPLLHLLLQTELGTRYLVEHCPQGSYEASIAMERLDAGQSKNGFFHVTFIENEYDMYLEIEDDGRIFYFAENINYIGTIQEVVKDIKSYLA